MAKTQPEKELELPALGPGEVMTPDGEVLSAETVAFSYTRQGRHEIGKEYPNPTPMEPPIGYVPSVPIYEQIRQMVRRELSQAAADEGFETMEEADDFDVDDDFDPSTPYEEAFEPQSPWPPSSEAVAAAERAAVGGGEGGAKPSPSEGSPPGDPQAQAPAGATRES